MNLAMLSGYAYTFRFGVLIDFTYIHIFQAYFIGLIRKSSGNKATLKMCVNILLETIKWW